MSPRFSGSLASVDGQVMLASSATIPATDHGLLRGDGAFEVVRLYDGRTFALEEHLKRLERSASNLRLAVDLDAIRTDARRLLSHAGAGPDHELLRIVVTRGGRRLLLTEPLPEVPDRARLGTITYAPTRVLDGVKSLSYGANMLASRMARERGYDEAFLASTVREVQPVAAIDDRSFSGVGPVTERLAEELAARIRSRLDGA